MCSAEATQNSLRKRPQSFHPLQLLCMTWTIAELSCRCHKLSVGAGNGSLSPLPAWEASFVIPGGGGEESYLPYVQGERELAMEVTKAGVPAD